MSDEKKECKSIFKNKNDEEIKKIFNLKWAEIINHIENNVIYNLKIK